MHPSATALRPVQASTRRTRPARQVRVARLAAPFLAALALLPFAPAVDAQEGKGRSHISAVEVLPRPYVDPAGSARILEDMLDAQPDRLELKLALVRELTAVGVIGDEQEERIDALVRAAEVALEVVEADSTSADAHHWVAVAKGLHADQAGAREKIELAREAHLHTLRALEIDPGHPGANHILGRLHSGTLRLSFVSRMFGRMLGLGEIMDEATWESAEARMRVAAAGEPDMLVYQLELARLLIRVEKAEEGWALMQRVADVRPRHELDAYYVRWARELIAERG
jgi:hypothetical protein